MFEIGLEWWRGLAQVAVYSAAIIAILWVMSKVEIKEREDKENV